MGNLLEVIIGGKEGGPVCSWEGRVFLFLPQRTGSSDGALFYPGLGEDNALEGRCFLVAQVAPRRGLYSKAQLLAHLLCPCPRTHLV